MNALEIAIVILIGILVCGYSIILFLIFKFGSKSPNIEKNIDFTPTVSLVIPTRNEEGIIKRRLENIVSMSYPWDKLEVLFIDGSNDSTPQIINEFANNYPFIRLETQKKSGFNNALNQGYNSARGEIVVKSDCDALPEKDALKNLIGNFADQRIGVVGGRHTVLSPLLSSNEKPIEKEFKSIQYKIQIVESYFHSTLLAHGALAGHPRKLSKLLKK